MERAESASLVLISLLYCAIEVVLQTGLLTVTIYRNALKSSNLMGGRPLYISVRGGGNPTPWIT
jgi:hypothetical protein